MSGCAAGDTVGLDPGGWVTGTITGGAETTGAPLSYVNRATAVTVTLTGAGTGSGTNVNAFTGIETAVGSTNTGNTLIGSNSATTWTVSGTDSGTVSPGLV